MGTISKKCCLFLDICYDPFTRSRLPLRLMDPRGRPPGSTEPGLVRDPQDYAGLICYFLRVIDAAETLERG